MKISQLKTFNVFDHIKTAEDYTEYLIAITQESTDEDFLREEFKRVIDNLMKGGE